MSDLFSELHGKLSDMHAEERAMHDAGKRLAEAECAYRVALNSKIIELRAEGQPVTITPDMARGDRQVAAFRMERDLAKTDWECARQRIFVLTQEVKIIDAQLSREWRAQ